MGYNMHLDKLFGSKTKVDILKYLLFRRQGISMRALETELTRTFPAIKKQIDSLKNADIVEIGDDKTKRSIIIKPEYIDPIKNLFVHSIQQQVTTLFAIHAMLIHSFYFWKFFGTTLDMDMIVIYHNCEKTHIEPLKEQISNIFNNYFIQSVSIVFMSHDERNKRYRLADKFVVNILKHNLKAHTIKE